MKIFTILETSGQHGNIYVNEIINEFKELEVYTLFKTLKERSFIFKFMRKFFYNFYYDLCIRNAINVFSDVEENEDVFLSFGGGFANYYKGKTIIIIDDCNFTEIELNLLKLENVVAVIVTTELMRDEYLIKYKIKKPIYVIPPAINFEHIKKMPHSGFNAIYYGHIINDHDIRILNLICKEMFEVSDFTLHVAGSFEKGTKTKLDKKINYYGHLNHSEILNLINIADLGLYIRIDSYNMSLRISIKVLEMMVYQLPIISNLSRPIPRDAGWTIEESEIPEKVRWCYENREEIMSLSNSNLERYNSKHVINEIMTVVKNIT